MTPALESGPRVLVVDDDPSVLACYRRLLRRAGYAVTGEGDPRRVLEAGASVLDPVRLLLLDYRMPEIDGLTLLAQLRGRGVKARCILISAFLNDDVRRQAERLGVDRVLQKPVDVDRLREALADLVPLAPATSVGLGG